jgi:alpha-glucuronidase
MITARLPFLTKMRWIVFLLAALSLHAETGRDAWLRYPLSAKVNEYRATTPAVIFTSSDSPVVATAEQELVRGFRGLIGRTLRMESHLPEEDAIVLTTGPDSALQPDGYLLKTSSANGHRYITISATTDRGVLYGAFALLRRVQLGESIASLNETQSPIASVRWVNQWDNLDGSIERGYGGRSIFWEGGHVRSDLTRVSEYGRLLASLGINGCAINNVNADRRMLSADFLPQIAKIAGALRPWGVRVVLSVDFASPQSTGGLKTFDPLDPIVSQWWQDKIDQLYVTVPDLAGLLMKADSEGRAGPSFYHRTHADAANMIARALKPHGGLILYRGFVYDHHMDWLNPRNDRARAAYDNFHSLDGQFADNAILQIKNGPIDFQVREPVSPLIAALKKTNQALELQITQEYTGQARHSVCLIPMWKDVLDSAVTPTTRIGLVGVANVGLSDSWLGNQLSLANLYGFGKLAWNPGLTSQQIIDEWTRLTFGTNPTVDKTIDGIQLTSWRTYENYTGPLGLQTLTDIVGNHYGVAVEASENNSWGQWHRADHEGVGMDRSTASGTGYAGQYPPEQAHAYESVATTPDDLLLFFHHVPYTHILHNGKTVIQTIYDTHYEGAASVESYVREWKSLAGLVDEPRYNQVLSQLEYQAGQAEVWRDAVTSWFLRASGIPDSAGRVGHYIGRVEAESMRLTGYTVRDVTPWEAASGGKAVECLVAQCSAEFTYHGAPGWFDVHVRYFDQNNGISRFALSVGTQTIDRWEAAELLPSAKLDGTTATRRVIDGVALRPGDIIRIEATPNSGDVAALDFVEIVSGLHYGIVPRRLRSNP